MYPVFMKLTFKYSYFCLPSSCLWTSVNTYLWGTNTLMSDPLVKVLLDAAENIWYINEFW